MIIKKHKLQFFMDKHNLTKEKLAEEMCMGVSEIEKLLKGEVVGQKTASLFIDFFGANEAQFYVDWDALKLINPLSE